MKGVKRDAAKAREAGVARPRDTGSAYKPNRQYGLVSLFIFVLATGLYLNTLQHGYVLDDAAAITGNQYVTKGISGIPEILATSYWHGFSGYDDSAYRPLSLVMFALEWELFPGQPWVHHLLNILVYAASCCLLF